MTTLCGDAINLVSNTIALKTVLKIQPILSKGLVAPEMTKAESPIRKPYRQTSDNRDVTTTSDFHLRQSPRLPGDQMCALYTG